MEQAQAEDLALVLWAAGLPESEVDYIDPSSGYHYDLAWPDAALVIEIQERIAVISQYTDLGWQVVNRVSLDYLDALIAAVRSALE